MMLTLLLPVSAVMLGASLAFYFKPKTPKGMKLLLAFSGAFLLGILVLEMLPKVYEHATKKYRLLDFRGNALSNYARVFF